MRRVVIVLACVLFIHQATSAQDNLIVLKVAPGVASLGQPQNGQVTLTLASGDKVTVRLADVDLPSTRKIMGMPTAPQASPAPNVSASELLLSPSALEATINQKCQEQWQTDFQIQAFCRKQQNEAAANLRRRTMSSADETTIRTRCIAQWPADFQMRNFCEEQQLKALQELRR